jgi:hypothetical protein
MKFSNSRKVFFFFAAVWISTFGAVAAEWDCITTAGVFKHSSDCTVSSEIVVTGTLYITGIPDAQGNLPKIIGGGSNRLFNVESGGELVMKNLILSGGHATGGGGAIKVMSATLRVISCVIRDNYQGKDKNGGGIFVEDSDSYVEKRKGLGYILSSS